MTRHLKICKKYLMISDAKQKTLSFGKAEEERLPSSSKAFTQKIGRDALARMLIKDELPMRLVEWEGFKEYSKTLNGQFVVPSRRTVGRDIEKLYRKEKSRLTNYIKESSLRICLTTDAWTSNQNISYMVLTGHFIDGQWNVHKKILNFCKIEDYRGDSISNMLEECLHSWGIEKICTITVDNTAYNDVAIENVVRSLRHENGLILQGEFVHVSCFAHILNLIVSAGIKEHDSAIDKVRRAVLYVKSSPKRLQAFKNCIDSLKIQFKGNVTLDVSTRWNSMYLMLANAEKYSKAFEKMGDSDRGFQLAMAPSGPPTSADWVETREFCKFLHVFYETAVKVSASSHITAHRYVIEICVVKQTIEKHCRSDNLTLIGMANGMIAKFNKYWGTFEKINILFFVALVLDPRCKNKIAKHCLAILFGEIRMPSLYNKIENVLERLYVEYRGDESVDCTLVGERAEDPDDFVAAYFNNDTDPSTGRSEVEEYLLKSTKNMLWNWMSWHGGS